MARSYWKYECRRTGHARATGDDGRRLRAEGGVSGTSWCHGRSNKYWGYSMRERENELGETSASCATSTSPNAFWILASTSFHERFADGFSPKRKNPSDLKQENIISSSRRRTKRMRERGSLPACAAGRSKCRAFAWTGEMNPESTRVVVLHVALAMMDEGQTEKEPVPGGSPKAWKLHAVAVIVPVSYLFFQHMTCSCQGYTLTQP